MKKKYKKLMLFLSLCLSLFIGLTVSSHAYYYNSDTGNLESSNVFGVADTTYTNYGVTISFDSGVISVSGTATSSQWVMFQLEESLVNNTYTFSFSNNSIYSNFGFSRIASMGNPDTEWFQFNSNPYTRNITQINYFGVAIFNGTTYTDYSTTIMCNIGSSALAYEPYGVTFYSQTNYNNYGASQYSQGYTDGFNSIYNSLIDVNLSQHITGIGCGIYDSTGTTFVQNGTITSSYFESNYYFFNVSPVIANNFYVIPISFDNNYVFSSFRWSPNRFTSPSLTINGVTYDSSTVTYNGTNYGWDNLNVNLDNSSNSIEFKFKINSNFEGVNLYINGKNLEIASALESYQSGYDNGQSVGYQTGYSEGFTVGSQSVTTDNSNFQKLIWTIGATPFESFKTIWDVDVMGLNISGIILGGLMALLVLYLIKKIWK